jgi:hypothetical protein
MNKIERAIYDTKLYIKDAELKLQLLHKEIAVRKEHLDTLEAIERDKLIPNEEVKSTTKEK